MRWEQLDASEQAQKDGLEFRQKLEEGEAELELETSKNRKKRQRGKAAKQKKKNLEAAGINRDVADDDDDAKGRLDEEEFTSVPAAEPAKQEAEVKESPKDSLKEEEEGPKPPPVATKEEIIPNDGSFLEMMKRQSPKQSEEDDAGSMPAGKETGRGGF
jgi:hypothetical protein